MRKLFSFFYNKDKDYTKIASVNKKVISEYNEIMLSVLTLICGSLMILPVVVAPFSTTKLEAIPLYLIISFIFFVIFFLFKLSFMKKYVLIGLYFGFSVLFLFAMYLSIIHTPHMRATILLGVFSIMPLGFIDRPRRMRLFLLFWFVLHTILAFNFKPDFALDDTINSLCFAIFGCIFGHIMLWARLDGYEVRRLLIVEKETDVLTGIYSRRKMLEVLSSLEKDEGEKPSGFMMIDIDNFKKFNDKFGHAHGDKCLVYLGEVFLMFSKKYRMDFYRYGGEEFVAIAYGYDKNELLSIANELRLAVQNKEINDQKITISIGVTNIEKEDVKDYMNLIDLADKAVYNAKNSGRNKVCVESN